VGASKPVKNIPTTISKSSQKTHRQQTGGKGFNALFAVSSVDAAKAYYEAFKHLQQGADSNKRLNTPLKQRLRALKQHI
jgi:predicted outer membrane protein